MKNVLDGYLVVDTEYRSVRIKLTSYEICSLYINKSNKIKIFKTKLNIELTYYLTV